MYEDVVRGPEPLGKEEFDKVMKDLFEWCWELKKNLGFFEDVLVQNDSEEIERVVYVGLRDFCELMGAIDSKVSHPADLYKIFQNVEFNESFRTIVGGTKDYDFVGRLREISESAGVRRADYQKIVKSAEAYLLEADIYLAGN